MVGVDKQLIEDGAYFVAEERNASGECTMVGCGGWSRRKTLFGSDQGPNREPELLDPEKDPARIRAIFVHPQRAGRGLGSKILSVSETAAAAEGFQSFAMGSTLTGFPL